MVQSWVYFGGNGGANRMLWCVNITAAVYFPKSALCICTCAVPVCLSALRTAGR